MYPKGINARKWSNTKRPSMYSTLAFISFYFWLNCMFVAQEGFGLFRLHTKEFVNLSSLFTVTIQGELPRRKEIRSPRARSIHPCKGGVFLPWAKFCSLLLQCRPRVTSLKSIEFLCFMTVLETIFSPEGQIPFSVTPA